MTKPFPGPEAAFLGSFDTGRAGPQAIIICQDGAQPEIRQGYGLKVIASAGVGAALLTKCLTEHEGPGGTLMVVGSWPRRAAVTRC